MMLFVLISSLLAMQSPGTPDARLEYLAIRQGYGYKYANLAILKDYVSTLELPYHLKVPDFEGLSSHTIKDVLKMYDFDLDQRWENVINVNFPTISRRETFYKEKVLPEPFSKACAHFREQLKGSLERAKDDKGFAKVHEFIGKYRLAKLMVRSTGKEDTKELSNAGGNESVANVTADFDHVFAAIIRVLESYFGEKSLLQRLRADDPSILEKDQLVPVLIQLMAGAADQTTISQCGVMFTEEPNMGNFTKDDQTTGISIIQSAYGHNESIVLGLVPFDTFYVDSKGNIYPIIRNKTDRLVPSEHSGELELVENDRGRALSPSLNEDAVRTLKALAIKLEELYRGPMDVEFVVTDDPKEVLIVQARPIIKRIPERQPSYFKQTVLKDHHSRTNGHMILHGGSFVRQCTGKRTIVAKNISEAYGLWTKNPNSIQCIILGDLAPETSHEATIFRKEGIALIQVDDYDSRADCLKSGKDLLLSPQQECMIEVDASTDWKDWIIHGWCSFPAPRAVSVIPGFSTPAMTPFEIPKGISYGSKFGGTNAAHILNDLQGCKRSIPELQISRHVLTDLIIRPIHENMQKLKDAGYPNLDTIEKDILLLQKKLWDYTEVFISDCQVESNTILASEPFTITSAAANRLLHGHYVTTLITQAPVLNTIGSISFNGLLNREILPLVKVLEKFPKNLVLRGETYFVLRLAEYCYTDGVYRNFVRFVLDLDKTTDKKIYDRFYSMVYHLFKIGVFPIWVQLVFRDEVENWNSVFNEYYGTIDLINFTLGLHKKLQSISPQSFSKLKSFEKSFGLMLGFVEKFTSSKSDSLSPNQLSFIDMFKSSDTSRTARIVAIKVMSELVENVDLSIKALKSSDDISDDNIVSVLMKEQRMVALLFKLLDVWYSELLVNVDEKVELIKKETFGKIWHEIEKDSLQDSDFYFSSGFRVSSASFYSSSSANRTSDVKTLEDAYSLTHQNLQFILGKLMVQSKAPELQIPEYLESIVKIFNLNTGSSQIIGVEMNLSQIIVISNEALRNHGLLKKVVYNRKKPSSARLVYWYAGRNNCRRWDNLLGAYAFYRYQGKWKIDNIEYDSNNGFGLEIILDDNEVALESLSDLLKNTSKMTNDYDEPFEDLSIFHLIANNPDAFQFAQIFRYILMKSAPLPEIPRSFDVYCLNGLCKNAYAQYPDIMTEVGELIESAGYSDHKYCSTCKFLLEPIFYGQWAFTYLETLSKKGDILLYFCFDSDLQRSPEVIDFAARILTKKILDNPNENYKTLFFNALVVLNSKVADELIRAFTSLPGKITFLSDDVIQSLQMLLKDGNIDLTTWQNFCDAKLSQIKFSEFKLPHYLQKIINIFDFNTGSSKVIGVEMGPYQIVVNSNEALRNHVLLKKKSVYDRNRPNSARLVYWYAGSNNSWRWDALLGAYAFYRFQGKLKIENIEYDNKNGFGLEIILNDNESELNTLSNLLKLTSEMTNNHERQDSYRSLNFFHLIAKNPDVFQFAQSLRYILLKSTRLPVKPDGFNFKELSELSYNAYAQYPDIMTEVGELIESADLGYKFRSTYEFLLEPMLHGHLALTNLETLSKKGNTFLHVCLNPNAVRSPEIIEFAARILTKKIVENPNGNYDGLFKSALVVIKSKVADELIRAFTSLSGKIILTDTETESLDMLLRDGNIELTTWQDFCSAKLPNEQNM